MAELVFDAVADRQYETGVDHGVLYSYLRPAAVWNGLVSVTESGSPEAKAYYYEGRKFLERIIPGAFEGKIEAITYPPVLDEITGTREYGPGVRVHDARPESFHLAYRTRIGNASDANYAYKLHLLYNLQASFDDIAASTIGASVTPTPFSWTISGQQRYSQNNQPLDHISIDSRYADPTWLANLEHQLYGTAGTDPGIPTPIDLIASLP